MCGIGRFECQSYIFEGQFKNGKWNGYGRFMTIDGKYIEGYFKENAIHGYAKRINPNGSVDEGIFEESTLV